MSKKQVNDLLLFLTHFSKEESEIVLWLREFVWDLYPDTNELIYDNYNALVCGWSPTDKVGHTFCSVAIGRTSKNIHFGFYWGSRISDPMKMLIGEGKQYRYLLVKNKEDFPKKYVQTLLQEALAYSLLKVKHPAQLRKSETITKSISKVKREKKIPSSKPGTSK